MPANTWAGEIGIIDADEGREYIFRPSFLALSRLSDDPREMLEIAEEIGKPSDYAFRLAIDVLESCYVGSDDLSGLIGRYGASGYQAGKCAVQCVYDLGIRLIVNGMCGRPRKNDGKRIKEWSPAVYAGHAMAHLGLSRADAWDMTMIELQTALEAKYPPPKDEQELEISQNQWDYYQKALKREAAKHGR